MHSLFTEVAITSSTGISVGKGHVRIAFNDRLIEDIRAQRALLEKLSTDDERVSRLVLSGVEIPAVELLVDFGPTRFAHPNEINDLVVNGIAIVGDEGVIENRDLFNLPLAANVTLTAGDIQITFAATGMERATWALDHISFDAVLTPPTEEARAHANRHYRSTLAPQVAEELSPTMLGFRLSVPMPYYVIAAARETLVRMYRKLYPKGMISMDRERTTVSIDRCGGTIVLDTPAGSIRAFI